MIAQGDDRRIRLLIDNAAQAAASGREREAERLLQQAQTESPRHPLVLNEIDIWNPHMSEAEREMVTRVTADVGVFYGTASYHEGAS